MKILLLCKSKADQQKFQSIDLSRDVGEFEKGASESDDVPSW